MTTPSDKIVCGTEKKNMKRKVRKEKYEKKDNPKNSGHYAAMPKGSARTSFGPKFLWNKKSEKVGREHAKSPDVDIFWLPLNSHG